MYLSLTEFLEMSFILVIFIIMLYNLPKAQWLTTIYIFFVVCSFSCACSWPGLSWSWWAQVGFVSGYRFDPGMFQIALILCGSVGTWVIVKKKMCKKASPIMFTFFKLLFLLYSQMYHWLKQDTQSRWKSKDREMYHLQREVEGTKYLLHGNLN